MGATEGRLVMVHLLDEELGRCRFLEARKSKDTSVGVDLRRYTAQHRLQ